MKEKSNTIYPAYNLTQIKESISKEFLEEVSPKQYDEFNKDPYKYLDYINGRIKKYLDNPISIDKFLRMLLNNPYRVFCDIGTDKWIDQVVIVANLLFNKELRDKLLIVTDGSYLNNRIWITGDITNDGDIGVLFDIDLGHDVPKPISDVFYQMKVIDKINWLYDHFEYVFLQVDYSIIKANSVMELMIILDKYIYIDYNKNLILGQTDQGFFFYYNNIS